MDNDVNELGNSPLSALLLSNRYTPYPFNTIPYQIKTRQKTQTQIVDLGASAYFFNNDAHKKNVDPTSPHIRVGTAYGQPMM